MKTKPWYLKLVGNHWYFLLLCVFFVTHGLFENVGLIPVSELLLLLAALFTLGLLCYCLTQIYFNNSQKSALLTFLFLVVFLFFGVMEDFMEKELPGKFVSSLTFLTLLSLVVLTISFFLIKKSKPPYGRLPIYLNLLLLIYILVDITGILNKITRYEEIGKIKVEHPLKLSTCDTCQKPSIYLVLLDEYSGSSSLKEYFNYDNGGFEDSLRSAGFHVVQQSHSNYYYTVYSVASMLNLDYFPGFQKHGLRDDEGYRKALVMIKNNFVIKYFTEEGYAIRNYSYFDMDGHPARFRNDYVPGKINLIIYKTMYARVIGQLLKLGGFGTPIISSGGDWEDEYVKNNQQMMQGVLDEKKDSVPIFTYIHLMMPHEPFVFNARGERTRKMLRSTSITLDEVDDAYLQYLLYTNQQVFQFIRELKTKTEGKSVIMLMSDHAYKGFERKENKKLLYSNLNALYLPNRKYADWKDGISNVNQFRFLFSTLFQQEIPKLKDSLIP